MRDLRAKLDQRDAEVALVLGQAGERRRDRGSDDRLHAEMRRADHIIDVADRRRVGGDDVDVHAKAVGVQADRVLHAIDPVDGVERRMRVKHHLPVAIDRSAPTRQEFLDVRLLDLVAAKLDLDIGEVAGEPARAEAGPDVLDGKPGHALGKLDRFADRMLACGHVGDIAALHAAALALAGAEHLQPPVVGQRADQRPDLRGADVQRCNQGLISRRGHVSGQPSTV